MHIQIADDYIITSDPHNFILNEIEVTKKGKTPGKQRLRPVAYYPTLPQLVDGLISKKMRNSKARTLNGLVQEHTLLIEKLKEKLKF